MSVVIFAKPDDIHVKRITEYLNDFTIISEAEIQNNITVAADRHGSSTVYLNDEILSANSVFWRNLDIYPFAGTDQYLSNHIGYMRLFLQAFDNACWVNPVKSFIEHYTKLDQMRIDANFPKTLITNKIDLILEFARQFDSVAVKPIAGGAYVPKLTADELAEQFSDDLTQPYVFQEFIQGSNLRTFVVGDDVFTARNSSELPDFRLDSSMKYTPIDLTAEQNQHCLEITRKLHYKYTAIDWIDRNGELFYLEANYAPIFGFFEDETGYPLSQSIAKLLIN